MQPPIITLTTDFGTADTFVGVMKGVILHIAPGAQIVDLTHDIPPQSVHAGAYALASAHRYFPSGTIHVVVVDPGVGTRRHPIAVRADNATFITPDNGLLSYLLDKANAFVEHDPFVIGRVAVPHNWHAIHLTNADYWLAPLSSTFHGRDIFAPIAAHIAAGVAITTLGTRTMDLAAFAIPRPQVGPGTAAGQVLHIDRFGNLITNLRQTDLPTGKIEIRVGRTTIPVLSETYQDGAGLVALIGGGGELEIAFRNGNASRTLGAPIGTDVHVISCT